MALSTASGVERIAHAFASAPGRSALMPYLMGGFPTLAQSRLLGDSLAGAGADLLELGVPFSDPMADGPAIQAAGERALAAGATFESVLEQVAEPLARQVPVIAMCYANLLLAHGLEAAAERLAGLSVAGLIVPDLPAEEAGETRAACDRHGVALVPLVAPTTPPQQVARIAAAARGFVYVVSVTGVTGERGELPPGLEAVVERVREAATVPVAVGFGIGTPEQVARVGAVADGVIVGSRLVRTVAEAPTPEQGIAEAVRFTRAAAGMLCAPSSP